MTGHAHILDAEQKRAALEKALNSHTFARSEQLRNFLKFICEQEMAGRGNEINEYLIGVEVMHRSSRYSPNEDGAVRNRAYALRNKLHEFYSQENPTAEVRIELPKGSYCPQFIEVGLAAASLANRHSDAFPFATPPMTGPTEPALAEQTPTPVHSPTNRWRLVAVIAIGVLAFAVWFFFPDSRRKTVLDEFWEPVLASVNPVLICTTQPVVYQLSGQAREDLLRGQAEATSSQPPSFTLAPDKLLLGKDVVPITDQYIGIGTAHAAAQLTAMFSRLNKTSQIKIGNEASFADLRHSPVVSVGAFGNRWTMSIANHLRFVFEEQSIYHRFIVDKADPKKRWGFDGLPITGRVAEDFVIISRVFQSETGEILITAAGITQYGTRAAGEFLTNPVYFETLARQAPTGWQKKNLQIVFSVKILDNTPGPPTVLATHFW
ncbi:MAG: hypothetical protein U0X75_04480 [Acidobacteriota bacterium]